jgi:hypothetical protein
VNAELALAALPLAEQLHVDAARWASEWRAQSIAYRKERGMKPFDIDPDQHLWLAHYEGFKAGVEHAGRR